MNVMVTPCPRCPETRGGRYGPEQVCWRCWVQEHGGDPTFPEPDVSGNGSDPTPGASSKLRLLNTLDLVTREPEPLDWLAEGVWARGKLTMFGGREKRGKSLVQLALIVCMVSGGGEVAGIKVKSGRVLLVDAENGEREIHRRPRRSDLTLRAHRIW